MLSALPPCGVLGGEIASALPSLCMIIMWNTQTSSDAPNSLLVCFGDGVSASPKPIGGLDVKLPLWSAYTQHVVLQGLVQLDVCRGHIHGSIVDDSMSVQNVLPLRHAAA